ncbi:MAG TPA: NAD(P)H-dependent glycerol-3-phosphate dehydrogenase [Fermentimonas caenicola]|jgi:glycerol-3-phosphate dehydrogenase (NAD(P)+)|uniref:Glycerol-3-phosphate dehydrogenase n=1 Tax=Fermentimonas caenicola TaxID=1562970 RepID=A0A098C2H6_9BACT|nr:MULTISPECIES: NAD(P)H-dependent glycerol-3-phosphate dehydrogenase [Lascolabacillus]MBP6175991.1 NAD(P)H-dependent glycerol-3-phosphate dehydrogenase [Fermentimonas sp.]MDI9625127.1 NAD(P)H-dependent glycerol-3-phosphate dehydrogenase [Bacteroidota bacterium]TAH62499.1 MAG: NAD(P)H-dependent glycerol-3-phosphate dehydrogenase [Fermentimonas caenicola]MBP6196665.1 NAD(P)H-dependent glycerol-3-phosphate dehydrogenase [Fermentimonas sp.]MBP7105046.1 NAD(P)H-dependent glycerol-3-phosphate dehyd
MDSIGKICILGGGTWGTALAKMVLMNQKHINWFIRRDDQIEGFYKLGHNPSYLTNVKFNLAQITFYSNLERAIKDSDTVIIAIPSPYVKQYFRRIWNSTFRGKFMVSALKGIIPNDNMVMSEYLADNFKIPTENIGVLSGPCHAEEVALERLSFLTAASKDIEKANLLSESISSRILKTRTSNDVVGIELAAVLKNIYAIASGICQGLLYGDNFQAVLMSNCAKEMSLFLNTVVPIERNITDQHYLGDMLVTSYSQFSRNRTLGTMIGKGYSVKTAQLEMEMIAEGYYGAKCIHEMNNRFKVNIPIVETVYKILYERLEPKSAIKNLIDFF